MSERDPADVLHGIPAIARHLGIESTKAKYWHKKKLIPTFSMGRTVCALKSSLAKHLAEREQEGRAGD